MSISFYVQNPPMKKVLCKDLYPNLDSSYFEDDPFMKKDEDGNFYEMLPNYPTFTVTSDTGYEILEAVGLQRENFGTIMLEDMPEIKRNIIKLNNVPKLRKGYSRSPSMSRGAKGAIFIDGGLSDERIVRNLNNLTKLMDYAMEHQKDIHWA